MTTTDKVIDEITKPPNRKARHLFNHFNIDKPYEMIQLDTLYITEDKGYKLILTAVDVASRYKWAKPLKSTKAKDALSAFKSMKIPLKKVKVINVDKGVEFQKEFAAFIKKNNIELQVNTPGSHLAFVERFNGLLSQKIFDLQYRKELKTKKPNTEWMSILPKLVDDFNNSYTRLIKMKPNDAIKLKTVEQPKNKLSAKDKSMRHNVDDVVRMLLGKDQILDVATGKVSRGRRRLTDAHWSLEEYVVVSVKKSCLDCIWMHEIAPVNKPKAVLTNRFNFWSLKPSS